MAIVSLGTRLFAAPSGFYAENIGKLCTVVNRDRLEYDTEQRRSVFLFNAMQGGIFQYFAQKQLTFVSGCSIIEICIATMARSAACSMSKFDPGGQ